MDDLFPTERHQQILTLLQQAGRVNVSDLSQKFGVSEVTIRSDLQSLAAQNLIVRTHGGAVLSSRPPELSLTLRRQKQVVEKERIGAVAAEWVHDGDAVFLDTSSTTLAIAPHLKTRRDLTVLTNSLAMVQTLMVAPHITVVMIGGVLRRDTASFIGADGLGVLSKYNLATGFFGAHGLSFPEGLTDVSIGEAEIKRGVVTLCRQVIAVIDSTKWGRVGPASFARPEEIHTIITDLKAPTGLVERVRSLGTRVIQV